MKNDVQLPANEIQTKQSGNKRNISIKQTRKRSMKMSCIPTENPPTPADTKSAEEAYQYDCNMEKMKSRT